MCEFAALCLTMLCMATSAQAGLFGGKWWKEQAPGEPIAEAPMSLEKAQTDWEVGPGLSVADDGLLGRKVLEHSGGAAGFLRTRRAVQGPYDIAAVVRITEEKASHHGVTLACGVRGPSSAPEWDYALDATSSPTTGRFCLHLTPRMGTDANRAYQTARPPIEDPVRTRWPHGVTLSDRYKDISPTWDEAFRREIEEAMARIPRVHDTWFTLRIELRPDAVRLWKDGFLVAERCPPGRVSGDVGLWLRGNVRVAALWLSRPAQEPEGFCPVRIGDACNAGLATPAMPRAASARTRGQRAATARLGACPSFSPRETATPTTLTWARACSTTGTRRATSTRTTRGPSRARSTRCGFG